MKTKWLFPHRFRFIGWLIFVPSAVLGLSMYGGYELKWLSFDSSNSLIALTNNLTDELASLGIIVGLLLIAFPREKVEDEMIGQLRLEALQWSVYANYIVLAIAIVAVYDTAFFSVMIYNMFTVLVVFILRFRWLIHRNANLLLL